MGNSRNIAGTMMLALLIAGVSFAGNAGNKQTNSQAGPLIPSMLTPARYDKLALLPIAIHAETGTPAVLLDRVKTHATDRVAHDLVVDRVADQVIEVAPGDTPPAGVPIVAESITMPVSNPTSPLWESATTGRNTVATVHILIRDVGGQNLDMGMVGGRNIERTRYFHSRAGAGNTAEQRAGEILTNAIDDATDRAIEYRGR